LRVATDEQEPRGGAHIEIKWASCARPSGLYEGGGTRGVVGNGRDMVLSSGRGPGGMGRGYERTVETGRRYIHAGAARWALEGWCRA